MTQVRQADSPVSRAIKPPAGAQPPRASLMAALVMASGVIAFGATSAPDPGSASLSRFGNLPLYFEASRGQAGSQVEFFARGQDHTIYLRRDGVTMALSADSSDAKASSQPNAENSLKQGDPVRLVHMTLLGCRINAESSGLEPLPGRVNYLLGSNPANWQRDVPTFAKVQYRAVYEGIDLVYYGNHEELEYDFHLAPHADASAIALKFDGADRLHIDAHGDLILTAGGSELRQRKPIAYQTIDGERHEVAVSYRIAADRTVSFEVGRYDVSRPLTIDPLLSYSTFLGGSRNDIGWAVAVDSEGRAYVAGETLSIFKNLPTSGEQTNSGGGSRYGGDAFVARLDFDETNQSLTLGYLTYLGGEGLDAALGIAVDSMGAAYITGYTSSTDFPIFPVPGVFQTNISGSTVLSVYKGEVVGTFDSHYSDAFVTKLDPSGFGVYSTYLGGELGESGVDIAVDTSGAAYVVGYTDSVLTFLVSNRVETARCTNGVCGTPVTRTNLTTTPLLVAVSAITNDLGFERATTNVVQSVVTTTLLSPLNSEPYYRGFPVANAIQTNNASLTTFSVIKTTLKSRRFVTPGTNILVSDGPALSDLFVTKISPDATTLAYSTYLGGLSRDVGIGIGLAPDGSASISGWTESFNFPVTNAFQGGFGGGIAARVTRSSPVGVNLPLGRDAVVAKLNPAGDALVFSTFLGGRGNDAAYRLAVDAAGATYVTGASGSTDFPSTPGALNGGGIFSSSDSSTSWLPSSSGLSHTVINALTADPFHVGTYYCGTPRGVFKTLDAGATWSSVSTGLVSLAVNALAIEPLTGSPVYAGTTVGLFQSTDGGLTWTNAETQLGSRDVRSILFDSATGTNLFVGTSSGVYARTNVTNWVARSKGLQSRSIRVLVDDGASLLYAGTDGGVHVSTNAGMNWKAFNKGLKNTRVRALAIDPVNASTLYAGTRKGIYKSMDAGTNWTGLTNGIGTPVINSLLIDPGTTSIIYAGTTNGLFRTTDAGATWSLSNSNLTAKDVATLIFAPGSTDTIYAGTRGTNFAGGTNDAFLVKFAPDGLALEYAMTFGGNRNDEGWDVAVDTDGNAYVTGQTASRNFPVRGPAESFTNASTSYQTNFNGKIDAFVVKVSTDGSSNVLSFFHGGKKNDFGHSIALDPDNNIFIVGRTESGKLPTTNSLVTLADTPVKLGGKRDGFVTKFLTGATALSVDPVLSASGSGPGLAQIRVSWPASAYEFRLEARNPNGGDWFLITEPITKFRGRNQVILPASSATLLFRLRM